MKKLLCALIVCVLSISAAYAKGNFKFAVSEDISYDDNIYLTKDDKKSSLISSTQLFADYLSTFPGTALKFGANANVGYNAYTEEAAKNDYVNAGLGLNLGNKIFSIDENFLYTADPATSELTDRAKRINNTAAFRLKTSTEKMFSLGFIVSDIYDKYIDDDYSDLNKNRINAGLQVHYNLSPKTSVYVGYLFSKITYEKTDINDSTGNSINLGVTGNITAKVKGTAQVSYDMRDYDKEKEGADNNPGIMGYLLSLTYDPTFRDTISLTGERKMEESSYANNRYYISTEVGVDYKHEFNSKWSAGIFAAYENMAYPRSVDSVKRADDFVKVRPSIGYKFKDNLFASVWYQLKNKTSNCEFAEYTDNKVGVQVKYCF